MVIFYEKLNIKFHWLIKINFFTLLFSLAFNEISSQPNCITVPQEYSKRTKLITITADTLAPCVAKSSAAMVLTN